MAEIAKCSVCGEPMPPGETMFKFHGYSGPCPKPPLPKESVESKAVRACRLMGACLQGFTAEQLKSRAAEIHGETFNEAQELMWDVINSSATGA